MKQVRITEAFIFAFESIKKYPMLLLAPSIFLNLISNSFSLFSDTIKNLPGLTAMASQSSQFDKIGSLFSGLSFTPFVIGIIVFASILIILLLAILVLIGITLQIGYIRIAFHVFDRSEEEPTWSVYNNFGTGIIRKYFWTALVIFFIVLGGLILFVVPGIVLSLIYQFALFILVEKKVRTSDALRLSDQLTNGIKWQLFGFALLVVFLQLLIVFPLSMLKSPNMNFLYLPLNTIIPPIVSMFSLLASIFVYKDISEQAYYQESLANESREKSELMEEKKVS
jgi:hypothetical protein